MIKIIVKPYLTEDIKNKIRGKATKIVLEDRYIEYLINWTKDSTAELTFDNELGEEVTESREYEDKTYCGGRINKEAITCINHQINTVLTIDGVEYVPEIEVEYRGNNENLVFSCQTEEEQMYIYKQLIDWKWN